MNDIRSHLEAALDAADPAEKNYHARQALQLLDVDVDVDAGVHAEEV